MYGDIQGYTYIGTIGQGNFGKVLLAENDITGEQVIVGLGSDEILPFNKALLSRKLTNRTIL